MDESRRDLIKKSVVAGGLVWMAPVVSSVAASAATGTPDPTTTSSSVPPPECANPGSSFCYGSTPICGGLDDACGECLCVTTIEGRAFCVGNPCICENETNCGSTSDCPDGFACVQDCGCQGPDVYVCMPPCEGNPFGNAPAPRASAGARRPGYAS